MSARKVVKAPRRQGRPPKEDSQGLREKIIAATRELLRTHPPGSISRNDIARAADVDAALIRYYFGSKDDVLSAVAETFMNDFVASDYQEIASSGHVEELINRMMLFTMDMIGRFPFMHDLLIDEIGRLGTARAAKIREVFIDRPTQRTERAIRATDSVPIAGRELQFLRMMLIAMSAFPLREHRFVEQTIGRAGFDTELTKEYCAFVARILAQGMKPRSR